jgi:acetyl esterase/lipase
MSHAGVTAVLEWMQSAVVGPEATLEEVRASFDAMSEPLPPGICVESVALPGLRGEAVGALSSRATLLYLHGGAYMIGSPASHRGLAGRLAAACAARVFVLDYRLSPEHVFPAAVDDAISAWGALRARGIPASQIVVGGDSAGGALALVVAMSARDRGEPPAAVFTFSAWTELSASAYGTADDPVLDVGSLTRLANQYLASASASDWRASPYHGDVSRLPPLLMQVGERELLRDQNRRFAARVLSAGGRVRLEEYAGMIHVFQMYASRLDEASAAVARVAEFVGEHVR